MLIEEENKCKRVQICRMGKLWFYYSVLINIFSMNLPSSRYFVTTRKILILRQEADRPTSNTKYNASLAIRDSLCIVFMDTFYVCEEYTCNVRTRRGLMTVCLTWLRHGQTPLHAAGCGMWQMILRGGWTGSCRVRPTLLTFTSRIWGKIRKTWFTVAERHDDTAW